MKTNLKIYDSQQNSIRFAPNEYMTSGGEGDIYLKKNIIYKIFQQPKNINFQEKILLLQKLQHPSLAYPIESFFNEHQEIVGFSMKKIQAEPVVKMFSSIWQQNHQFDLQQQLDFINKMRELLLFIHQKKAVVADGNEMNWLFDSSYQPFLIDLDSWQIGQHPATALMPSIKDWHSQSLNSLTDWFAWAIVSFQILTGIHPYKGNHPNFKKGDLTSRMKANVSVFHNDVRYNSAVRDFSLIPKTLKDWYYQVFEKGFRDIPPIAKMENLLTSFKISSTQNQKNIHHQLSFLPIQNFSKYTSVIFLQEKFFLLQNLQDSIIFDFSNQKTITIDSFLTQKLIKKEAFILRKNTSIFIVYLENNHLFALNISLKKLISSSFVANQLYCIENRLFILNPMNDTFLSEIELQSIANNYVFTLLKNWNIFTQSTQFFTNMAISNNLGTYFSFIPKGNNDIYIHKINISSKEKWIQAFATFNGSIIGFTMTQQGILKKYILQLKNQEFIPILEEEVDMIEDNICFNNKGILISNQIDSLDIYSSNFHQHKNISNTNLQESFLFPIEDKFYMIKKNYLQQISLVN
jgi:hypothetical protein